MIFKFGGKIDVKINWSVKKPVDGHKGVARSGYGLLQTFIACSTNISRPKRQCEERIYCYSVILLSLVKI